MASCAWFPTPQLSLQEAIQESHLKRVAQLCANGTDVNAPFAHDGKAFASQAEPPAGTPLGLAASLGHEKVVAVLCDHGADVNRSDRYGCTPLIYAARDGHADVVRMLCARGADVNHRFGNPTGKESVKLLQNRATSVWDCNGNTVLHFACHSLGSRGRVLAHHREKRTVTVNESERVVYYRSKKL